MVRQELKAATEEALEQLSNSIYRTSVYQDTMKEPKHSLVQRGEGPGNRAVRFIGEEEETWEVSDQEDVKISESSDDDDQIEVIKMVFSKWWNFQLIHVQK